jgi:DNA polymerase-3 subunit epsilon
MREIVLDTETTGLDPIKGSHRIVEIGCIEIFNKVPTGNFFHAYINPERTMPDEAYRIHGISYEFLQDKPKFIAIKDDFISFIANDPLVIHNAQFDMKFLQFELSKFAISLTNTIVDTLIIARKKYPGGKASLDALCKKFNIDLARRDKHGALLDAELLASVYLNMEGGSQASFNLNSNKNIIENNNNSAVNIKPIRELNLTEEELIEEQKFLESFFG